MLALHDCWVLEGSKRTNLEPHITSEGLFIEKLFSLYLYLLYSTSVPVPKTEEARQYGTLQAAKNETGPKMLLLPLV